MILNLIAFYCSNIIRGRNTTWCYNRLVEFHSLDGTILAVHAARTNSKSTVEPLLYVKILLQRDNLVTRQIIDLGVGVVMPLQKVLAAPVLTSNEGH